MVAVDAIWRAMPRRGLAMNSLRLGWTVAGAAGGGWVMTRVSRFQTESSRKESAPDQDRCWASASPKPPRKRWRAEVSTPGGGGGGGWAPGGGGWGGGWWGVPGGGVRPPQKKVLGGKTPPPSPPPPGVD